MKPQNQVPDIPNAADRHLWQIQPFRDATWIFVVVLLAWLGYALRSVTVPLLVALLLAYLFEPLISLMERRLRFPRPLAVGAVLAVGGLTLIVVIALTVPLVIGQTVSFIDAVRKGKYTSVVQHVVEWAPDTVQPEIETFVQRAEGWIGIHDASNGTSTSSGGDSGASGASAPGTHVTHIAGDEGSGTTASGRAGDTTQDARIRAIVRDEIAAQSGSVAPTGRDNGLDWFSLVGAGVQRVWSVLLGAIQLGLLVFLIPFYFFAFSVWWPRVIKFGHGMILEAHRDRTLFLLGEMDNAVSGFVRGRIVICAILAVLYSTGWSIAGVPYAIPLGVIVGIFTLVPYLGGIGLPLSIGLLAADQFSIPGAERMAWWGIILWPALIFVICQFLDDYVLTPLIAGKATNLDPVTIVVAILAGGALAGLYGMLIAIPVAACIKILLREILMPRIRDWIEGRVDDPLPIEE
jgi:predicted PurR-regulated permease PerM